LTSELEKLHKDSSSKILSGLKSTSEESADSSSSNGSNAFEAISDLVTSEDKKAKHTSETVNKEVAELKKRLTSRKKLDTLDTATDKARSELVNCLRINDRRPLDCWEQREAFKKEVLRLEKEFVEKTIR
jgi:altered-inheritance-of-mitochondria protein 13